MSQPKTFKTAAEQATKGAARDVIREKKVVNNMSDHGIVVTFKNYIVREALSRVEDDWAKYPEDEREDQIRMEVDNIAHQMKTQEELLRHD